MKVPKNIHYIFGYGSLICSKSRRISAPTLTKDAIPVVVNNLRRTWTARVGHRSKNSTHDLLIHGQTAMGIEACEGHNCTGVIFEVNDEELAKFDDRERGYDRVEVDLLHVFPHEEDGQGHLNVIQQAHRKRRRETKVDSESGDGNIHHRSSCTVWVYLPQGGGDGANHRYPIMQSYVDIIVRGCLNIGKEFTRSFLESTHGWWHDHTVHGAQSEIPEYLWVDDRHDPYYVRADKEWSEEMKHFIDNLLKDAHPEPLKRRKHLDTIR